MPLKDHEARKAYHRAYMSRRLAEDPLFKQRHLDRIRRNDRKARAEVLQVVAWFKTQGCKLCGEPEPCCLEAHHVDPSSKEFEIGSAATTKKSLAAVKAELAKCVCLCANCHRKVHAGRLEL
ncbi:MAG TPA: hypothetical protein VFT74_09085 [Isosphaeraceae bacterium]|nr:hypothetical protein [Isosphaeraceae bacterium]